MKNTPSHSTSVSSSFQSFIEGPEIQGKIREDGGDIRFEGVQGHTVLVLMTAACADCPSGGRTVQCFVEPALKARFGNEYSVRARFVKPYFKA